jgi:hypothetical protein
MNRLNRQLPFASFREVLSQCRRPRNVCYWGAMRKTETSTFPTQDVDDLDILSATWILSCNDENPILTYKGISTRLKVADTSYVKSLVLSRRELFRPGIPCSRLESWKAKMKEGGRPGWISELTDRKEQEAAIDSISVDDVFRNQFRPTDGAKTTSMSSRAANTR